jgi:outer membrane protein assembly factor BamB
VSTLQQFEDEAIMATESSAPEAATRKRMRARFPWIVIALVAAALAVIWLLPADSFDRGMQMSLTFVTAVVAALLLNGWWILSSRVTWRTRLVGEAAVILALVAFVLSIRGVEFTGDMTPIMHWRWEPSHDAVLEAHRAKTARAIPVNTSTDPAAPGLQDAAEYRGRARDGVVLGPALARDWNKDPPELVWRQPVGGGYAAFSLTDGRAVTIEQRRDKEAVVCYDAATGHELWVHDYLALFSESLGGDGPRATPTIVDGEVYALGATGVLTCLDLSSGAVKWTKNILELNGVPNVQWAMSGSPLVVDKVVIVNPGAQKGTADSRGLMALDRATGDIVWRAGRVAASYSSPMLVAIGNTRQVLIFDAGGLAGHDAATGEELWRVPWTTQFDINAVQPLVIDNSRILITSATGATLIAVEQTGKGWVADELWRNRNLKCSFSNPVYRQGFVYGLDEGILVCVDVETGARKWKQGRYGHGQLLLCGDLLVILSERGELALVEASPEEYRELARIQAIEGKTWNCPVLVDGRAYIRNHLEMACYDLRPMADRGVAH